MAQVHLIEGPVGAGKSTYARGLEQEGRGVHIALDAWFAALFSPDRPAENWLPWYIERKERLLRLIWAHAERLLDSGHDVILELGLIQRAARLPFCQQVIAAGHPLCIHVLDAPTELRRERVQRRNAEQGPTFSMVVPDAVFDMASQFWEAPDAFECEQFRVEWVAALGALEATRRG
ncbi:MAG: ATP-binding protein [Paucibacter sp.]|nr:ATP-binding protein [Roseateles sp.]